MPWALWRGGADRLKQLASAQAEVAHRTLVHALHDQGDRRVAFGEREERQMAQPPQNVSMDCSCRSCKHY